MKKLTIRNPDECVTATKRAEALSGAMPGSDNDQERIALLDAIKVYEHSIAMMRGVGRKASDSPEKDVSSQSGEE